jgi:asparagine synthase (glutamine-hydrolysing)
VLAHRRLSIVDLSEAGHQPMHSASGRWVIVFNGEIYNHLDLRASLGQNDWRGHSDTETLLAGFERWGIRATVERCVGMFAMAVWDRKERELSLVRDRFGEKPLYYGWQKKAFLFASELKALSSHPDWEGEIDQESLAQYMRYSYVPAPRSIFRGLCKLEPGTIVTLSAARPLAPWHLPAPVPYWSLRRAVAAGAEARWEGSDREAVDQVNAALRTAVAGQMVADVPLGAFLSGGVDSSTIVALMQEQSQRPVQTFSIGFSEEAYDEARYAKEVARHLGTDHTELYVSPEEAQNVIPRLPIIYDEPFADSSQIPTFLVAQLARRSVTVSLSGDAGDELFGGYNRYFLAAGLWPRITRVPWPLRRAVAGGLLAVSPATWDRIHAAASPLLPSALRVRLPGEKLHKGARVVSARNGAELYAGLVSQWDPTAVMRNPSGGITVEQEWPGSSSLAEQMMAWDSVTYLPDDILTKVDRAAMAVSLETRVPFLDHRVAELAWKLPLRMKLRDGKGKWVLREVLYRYVPKQLVDRPKAGFGVPIGDWLRGPLRAWAESLLSEDRLRDAGLFNVPVIRGVWDEHLAGRRNCQHQLWNVLMFEAWRDEYRRR